MTISHIGHSCFKIRGKRTTLLTDPYSPDSLGLSFPRVKADIVTISHNHQDHNYKKGVKDSPVVFSAPGEYEVKGVRIRGLATYHDDKKGKDRGKNTIFRIEIDRISILHCGDLGHPMDDEITETLDEIDIIMIPVGGIYTIDAKKAVEVVTSLEPKIVIPMHYKISEFKKDSLKKLSPVSDFLREYDKAPSREGKLKVSKRSLPEEQMVVVLE